MQDPITGSKLCYNTSNSQEARSSKDKQIKSQNSPRLQFQHNQDILKECMLLGVAAHGYNIWKLKQEACHSLGQLGTSRNICFKNKQVK